MAAGLPFEDSRRLIGANVFAAAPAAVLETAGIAVDADLLDGWRTRVTRACARLGWTESRPIARTHARGASLAITAAWDRLFTATEVNEWALCATVAAHTPELAEPLVAALHATLLEDAADPAQVLPPVLEEGAALERLRALAMRERRPALAALLAAANERAVPVVLDDTELTLGLGVRSSSRSLEALPDAVAVPWSDVGGIPFALVTGSNGKTTTVRLVAACTRAHGWRTASTNTEGVWIDDAAIATGDWSGPDGARRAMRDARAEAAVLETARGGILRRGIAVNGALAAVVTNVSSDHFGEYGIDDLAALADAKLTLAGALAPGGRLVLNADDPLLAAKATTLAARFGRSPALGWFAADADAPTLRAHRAGGGATCGAHGNRLVLNAGGTSHDLGELSGMPLTVGGRASYNVANLAAAALAADALGVPAATIARTFANFGTSPQDNVGRLMRYEWRGVHVLVDYAHNPSALRAVLAVARGFAGRDGRLGMLLGHAGNRLDADIASVARVAAEFRPELVVVKENEAQLRGRAPGEVPAILRTALRAAGVPESAVAMRPSELEAANCALEWARPGDALLLPLHSRGAREAVIEILAAP